MKSNQNIEMKSREDLIAEYQNREKIDWLMTHSNNELILCLLTKNILTFDMLLEAKKRLVNSNASYLLESFISFLEENNEISLFLKYIACLTSNGETPSDRNYKDFFKIYSFLETLAIANFHLSINDIPKDLLPIIMEYIPPIHEEKEKLENYSITPFMKQVIDAVVETKKDTWRIERIKSAVNESLDQYIKYFKYETGKELADEYRMYMQSLKENLTDYLSDLDNHILTDRFLYRFIQAMKTAAANGQILNYKKLNEHLDSFLDKKATPLKLFDKPRETPLELAVSVEKRLTT